MPGAFITGPGNILSENKEVDLMRTALIACEMMEDEIALAMERTGFEAEPIWLDRQLHTIPDNLRGALQEILDGLSGVDRVLMAFARCGNALVGLQNRQAELILPRFEDCIHLLQSHTPGNKGDVNIRTLYLTRGWLQGERAFLNEYAMLAEEHGEELAREIYQMMMGEYQNVAMIDTGAYSLGEAEQEGRKTAALLGLGYDTCPGTVRVLEKLFAGRWDEEEFLVVPPGGIIQNSDF